jgi:hypothetical protein
MRVEVGRDRVNSGWYDLRAVSPRADLLHCRLLIKTHQGRRELVTSPEPSLESLCRFHNPILPPGRMRASCERLHHGPPDAHGQNCVE